MKNIRIQLGVVTLLFLLNACNKIDQKIYDQQTTADIKTQADVEVAIMGVYGQFTAWNGFKAQFPLVICPYADDLSSIQGASSSTWGTKTTLNSGIGDVASIWSRFYMAISNANAVIGYANSLNSLSPTYKTQARAEGKFLRGLSYFYLVQYFGAVPLITSVVDYKTNYQVPRNSVDSVYQLIFSDFSEGITSLPLRNAQPTTQYNRATQGAAQGFLAKAYLNYANYLDLNNRSSEAQNYYDSAKLTATAVIGSNQYVLLSDFSKLWDVNNKANAYNEVIFGISYTRDYTNTDATTQGNAFATAFNPQSRGNVTGRIPGHGGLGYIRVHPWFYEKYTNVSAFPSAADYVNSKDTDYRVQTSFLTSWINSSTGAANGLTCVTYPYIPGKASNNYLCEPQPYINKYIDPNGVTSNDNANDLFLLRYSEMYFIVAEAENEMNGPSTTALVAFNLVRQRARKANGISHTYPIDLTAAAVPTKEAMRMKIFDERGLEFVGEMNRWFDLVRMRYSDNIKTMYEYQFGTFLPTLTPGLPVYKNKVWSTGRTEASNIIPFDKKYMLFPIPANETAVNPNLTQNPGW